MKKSKIIVELARSLYVTREAYRDEQEESAKYRKWLKEEEEVRKKADEGMDHAVAKFAQLEHENDTLGNALKYANVQVGELEEENKDYKIAAEEAENIIRKLNEELEEALNHANNLGDLVAKHENTIIELENQISEKNELI